MEQLRRQSFALSACSKPARIWIIIATTLMAGIAVAYLPAIPQATHYHNFADQRGFWEIPNILNVVSNLAFVLGGIAGFLFLHRRPDKAFSQSQEKHPWRIFFVGAILTGIGSAYYHVAPDNPRLLWDRLPMTVVFMSLLAAIISERISAKVGTALLFPLVLFGSGSVLYWYFSEQIGQGDLRPYGFVQFCPILLLPLILLLFPARYTNSKYLIGMIGVYAVAKVSETLDAEIFALGQIASGHTLKHLIASLPIFLVLRMLRTRSPLQAEDLIAGKQI